MWQSHVQKSFLYLLILQIRFPYGAQAVLKRVVCLSPPHQTCLFCLNSAFLSALVCAFIYRSAGHQALASTQLHGPLLGPPSSGVHPAQGPSSFAPSAQARWLSQSTLCQVPLVEMPCLDPTKSPAQPKPSPPASYHLCWCPSGGRSFLSFSLGLIHLQAFS